MFDSLRINTVNISIDKDRNKSRKSLFVYQNSKLWFFKFIRMLHFFLIEGSYRLCYLGKLFFHLFFLATLKASNRNLCLKGVSLEVQTFWVFESGRLVGLTIY